MQNAGSVCCCMLGCLVQSPDTHHRGVATRVCLQHLGSRGRFVPAHRIFGSVFLGRLTAVCLSARPFFATGNLADAFRWLPTPARKLAVKPVGTTAQAITTFPMLPMFSTVPQFFVQRTSTFPILHCTRSNLPLTLLTWPRTSPASSGSNIPGSFCWRHHTASSLHPITRFAVKQTASGSFRPLTSLPLTLCSITSGNVWNSILRFLRRRSPLH